MEYALPTSMAIVQLCRKKKRNINYIVKKGEFDALCERLAINILSFQLKTVYYPGLLMRGAVVSLSTLFYHCCCLVLLLAVGLFIAIDYWTTKCGGILNLSCDTKHAVAFSAARSHMNVQGAGYSEIVENASFHSFHW